MKMVTFIKWHCHGTTLNFGVWPVPLMVLTCPKKLTCTHLHYYSCTMSYDTGLVNEMTNGPNHIPNLTVSLDTQTTLNTPSDPFITAYSSNYEICELTIKIKLKSSAGI